MAEAGQFRINVEGNQKHNATVQSQSIAKKFCHPVFQFLAGPVDVEQPKYYRT